MYTNDRATYRQLFFIAWQKYLQREALNPIEQQLAAVILAHPEYHALLEKSALVKQDYAVEENPFIHMSLHMSLREQIKMDHPLGIARIFQALRKVMKDDHASEHAMMQCMANFMWRAQKEGIMANDQEYLQALREILG